MAWLPGDGQANDAVGGREVKWKSRQQ